jgi:hypothetical protein
MSNSSYSTTAPVSFKRATSASTAPASLLRELFQATPLYIFATAVKAALRKPSQR